MAIMAVLVAAELAAVAYTIGILSAVRAYVGGEGAWSKAQKDAIYYLTKYTYTHDEKDYQSYVDLLKIPLSDHQARLALNKKPIDIEAARQEFLKGNIHPDDIDGVIRLFLKFSNFYYLNKAIKAWEVGDQLLFELIKQGDKLHRAIISNKASPKEITENLNNIDQINKKLTENENEFSYTLGEGSRWIENMGFQLLLSIAIIVELTGIFLTILIGIKISKNIKAMNAIASKVGLADFSERVTIPSKDEIGQLATSFNTMIDKLDQHDKLKNEFIAVLSHELRTPLTSIKGSLDLLTDDMMCNLSAFNQQILLNLAKKNCEHLIRLINDLLDVEKIDSGHMEFLIKPLILNDLLKEATTANQPYGDHFHVKIKLIPSQENVTIEGDYDRLTQVLSNLISNAIKFSSPNKEVIISSALSKTQVEISVADNGPGIPIEFQTKIFQKFAQADPSLSRKHTGTGLGLNISKTIIERHGGTIFFKTKENQGTTFYFTLPIKQSEPK